ncbi:hypothetical protein M378DRAFT_866705 [Amanita muscaria Koide BX008]|uniref:Uncharacterized protein n=1 Tax=Amanita muscaria (strain Koide BX008) TaxID=946122 RepID=A0A0C2WI12_AMAMK|nr:hypothetical protein M378DRAFT_866705 [Amanita muscaria Koide BX008]
MHFKKGPKVTFSFKFALRTKPISKVLVRTTIHAQSHRSFFIMAFVLGKSVQDICVAYTPNRSRGKPEIQVRFLKARRVPRKVSLSFSLPTIPVDSENV